MANEEAQERRPLYRERDDQCPAVQVGGGAGFFGGLFGGVAGCPTSTIIGAKLTCAEISAPTFSFCGYNNALTQCSFWALKTTGIAIAGTSSGVTAGFAAGCICGCCIYGIARCICSSDTSPSDTPPQQLSRPGQR